MNQTIEEEVANQSILNGEKLVKWIDDPHRGKAAVIFTEGIERQIANRFETLFDRLKTLK